MATDGRTLYYNRDFVDKLSDEELVAIHIHEICHPMFHHCERMGVREPFKWNVATDYAINLIVKRSGRDGGRTLWQLPKGALLDEKYDDMYAEEIYNLLPEQPQGNSQPDPGQCGGIAVPVNDQGQPLSQSEQTNLEEEWKIATAQAAQIAKRRGDLPAGLDRFIEELLNPTIDWRAILQRFVSEIAKDDYRWYPPNKRYVWRKIYLPSVRSEALPPIVVGIDTSGSVDQVALAQFAGELTGILQDYNTTCTVIYCDAKVSNVETFTQDDLPLQLHPKGFGGTDFRPVFDYVEQNNIDLCCLIYMTDLDGRFPDKAPNYPVLWARLGGHTNVVPFGDVVTIKAIQ
jgi:predicted metal-dependent peptidase